IIPEDEFTKEKAQLFRNGTYEPWGSNEREKAAWEGEMMRRIRAAKIAETRDKQHDARTGKRSSGEAVHKLRSENKNTAHDGKQKSHDQQRSGRATRSGGNGGGTGSSRADFDKVNSR
ncbi:unnamed protein product, partial [Amoebophrya sp. A25]